MVGVTGITVARGPQPASASANPVSAPIKSHNFRIVDYLPFTINGEMAPDLG
jgi:hypothetical protein